MPGYTLETQVSYQPQMAIIKMAGEINGFAEEALNRAYAEAERSTNAYIMLNFTSVKYMNSTGIALIVGVLGQARRSGKKLLACGLSPHFVEIFQITRLSDFIKIYPDELSIFTDPDLAIKIS
ncbi:MAG TPA: STAS domain-containing protein [Chloroflexia bacterium]|nr:STAS domain-containing protein [Chloroflexia bacterium]